MSTKDAQEHMVLDEEESSVEEEVSMKRFKLRIAIAGMVSTIIGLFIKIAFMSQMGIRDDNFFKTLFNQLLRSDRLFEFALMLLWSYWTAHIIGKTISKYTINSFLCAYLHGLLALLVLVMANNLYISVNHIVNGREANFQFSSLFKDLGFIATLAAIPILVVDLILGFYIRSQVRKLGHLKRKKVL